MREKDGHWMQRAIQLARQGIGLTRPNPPVGAVLVKSGRIVGEGWHRQAGTAHAEVKAIQAAGSKAKGATLYVTLEPCSTFGKTPPCTEAILQSGIRRVVIGCLDPNPVHHGRGVRILRSSGIEVTVGVQREDSLSLVEAFSKWVRTGRPWVTLKMALSIDGRVADASGNSRWITGKEARRSVHDLRRTADAIMVGKRTALLDDPTLLPRPALGRKPLRIVLDSHGSLPLRLRLFTDGHSEQTVVFTSWRVRRGWVERVRATGASIVRVRRRVSGLDLNQVLLRLGEMGVMHLLCEGGGQLAGNLVRARLVDRLVLYFGPRLLGECSLPGFVLGRIVLARAPRLFIESVSRAGDSIQVTAHLQ